MFPNQTALSETSLLGVSTLKAASKQKASHKIKAFVAITITVDNNNGNNNNNNNNINNNKQKASHKIKAFTAITITVDNNNHRRTLGVLLILKVAEKLKGGFTIQH